VIFFIPIGSMRVLSMKTHVRGSLQREREQQMLFDHIRSTTSCKIAFILVQVLFLLAFASPDSLFLSTCFLFIDSWWIFLASLALNWDCGRCHYPGPRNGLLSFGCS
jgi:hypothetical protein